MKKIFFLSLVIFFQCNFCHAEDEGAVFKDIPYPEKKYYDKSYSVRETFENGLKFLYMKDTLLSQEVDLIKINETFFTQGTKGKQFQRNYLKEAGQENSEEWLPPFYEFGDFLRKKGKKKLNTGK